MGQCESLSHTTKSSDRRTQSAVSSARPTSNVGKCKTRDMERLKQPPNDLQISAVKQWFRK